MDKHKYFAKKHQRRQYHIRKKCIGTPEKPRLAVFRSNRYIYSQLIDDTKGNTLASCSSLEEKLAVDGKRGNRNTAALVGKTIAERAKAKGIEKVTFDRGGFRYHGCIKILADAAREAGLKF
ncbi:MAG: 50S ribosomal protein L18 [Planctomycetota bacterium]